MTLILLIAMLSGVPQSPSIPSPHRIEGTVVAYNPFSRLTIIVGSVQNVDTSKRSFHETFLVRVEHDSGSLKKGQLIRLKYDDDTGAKPTLPTDVFTQEAHWAFDATQDNSCTSNLEAVLYYRVDDKVYANMQLTSWTKTLKAPLTTDIPCYVVASGGFAKL